MTPDSTIFKVFTQCAEAIHAGKLIRRASAQDKEFHFQNWIRARLQETGLHHEVGGRNSYPDFRMVSFTEGYEVKGLAYPSTGTEHVFRAWRLVSGSDDPVVMRQVGNESDKDAA